MTSYFLPGVAALGLVGGLAGGAGADPPAPAPAAPAAPAKSADPQRQIIRWPGGWMYLDQPGVIYHDRTAPGPATVVTNSANGVGNRIVIDTGGAGGVTVVRNVRNGVGNSLTVTPAGPVIELPAAKPPAPAAAGPRPAAPLHQGRKAKFWAVKGWSDAHDCTLYWDPAAARWYRYDRAADCYRPLPEGADVP
jgi:hypothetical protein